MRLGERSAGELMVLLIAVTVCSTIVISLLSTVALELFRPETDSGPAISILSDTINTLIGVMAGFLAGRTQATPSAEAPG